MNTNNPFKTEEDKITALEKEISDLEARCLTERRAELNAPTKAEKAASAKTVKNTKIEIDLKKRNLEILKANLTELILQEEQKQQAEEKKTDKELDEISVQIALSQLNASYIVNGAEWHCIYTSGIRHQPSVKVLTHEEMIDHVYLLSDHYVDKIKLKQIAKASGRMYRDVERSFRKGRDSVLNQLDILRQFWLKPVFGQDPHIGIELLTSNLVGNNEDYKNQIEKYIAYSYVKPEDIFAPNIDSSAKGGTGRDTFFRMLEIIFTEECCGEAKKETVQGTHNGELNGKIWVKVSEQNNRVMNIEELKNLTGGHNFRLREMGKDAVQTPRTFRFFMMSNNYEGTAKLTGGGGGSEDRRWEPILCNTSLLETMGEVYNKDLKDPQEKKELQQILQDWQDAVFQNEDEIAKWLGHIIERHGMRDYYEGKVKSIEKLTALHGVYYTEMVERQKRAFDNFIEAVYQMSFETGSSTCLVLNKMWQIYRIVAFGGKMFSDKASFAKAVIQWLNLKTGINWEVKVSKYYTDESDSWNDRKQALIIKPCKVNAEQDGEEIPDGHVKLIFDVFDFINDGEQDDKGKDLGDKPHVNNIKEGLL